MKYSLEVLKGSLWVGRLVRGNVDDENENGRWNENGSGGNGRDWQRKREELEIGS